MRYFHFTLGPVQGFVAQARRIRDFWAGSFLLSWLAAVAMRTVKAQGGTIEFPAYDENYMAWLKGEEKSNPPRQGGVPNRFMAKVPDGFDGKQVADAVQQAWEGLADAVWQADLAHLAGTETEKIWNRQIENFWEISWVLTDGDDETAMDRRKNWRNYALPVEEGLPCSLMDGWVELSGAERPGKPHKEDRVQHSVAEFWKPLREKLGRDLNDREQLCAIAFVKRRFAGVFHQVQPGWKLDDVRIPSINDMAAVHWLEGVLKNADDTLLNKIADQAGKLKTPEGQKIEPYGKQRIHPICCIQQAYNSDASTPKGRVAHLNGEVFFEHALRNGKLYDKRSIDGMLGVSSEIKAAGLASPTPYYAILLMDGDNMGKALRDAQKAEKENRGWKPATLSKALLAFNHHTAKQVEQHNGFLIYAGGDDVLALLPVEDALDCAYRLHEIYGKLMANLPEVEKTELAALQDCQSFEDWQSSGATSTLSGAIQFAHVKTPLTLLLQDAHGLLDKVAKQQHGRDSLAVRVWNHGGKGLEWAMPWSCATDGDGLVLQKLLADFQDKDRQGGQFSSGFFYKIREFFHSLTPREDKVRCPRPEKKNQPPEETGVNFDVYQALLENAYLASGKNPKSEDSDEAREKRRIEAKQQVEKLLGQCRCIRRETENGELRYETDETRINPDGALLLRFLSNKTIG